MEIKNKITAAGRPGTIYDPYFMTEYGKIEALRATRYNTSFSIILIDSGGGEAGPPDEVSEAVLSSVRVCDVVGLTEENGMLVILPETDYFGSLTAIRKVSRSIEAALGEALKTPAVLSQASFPKDGKDFGELLGAAAKRCEARRASIWEKLGLRDMIFWEIMGKLTSEAYGAFETASFDAGTGFELSEFFIDQINELIIKEISRSPQKRGLAYFSAKKVTPEIPVLKSLSGSGQISTKVFLVGEGDARMGLKNASPVILDDPRLKELCFTFFLGEDSCYALIAKENWGGTFSCFHSSDGALVEGLIAKFQAEYSLQDHV